MTSGFRGSAEFLNTELSCCLGRTHPTKPRNGAEQERNWNERSKIGTQTEERSKKGNSSSGGSTGPNRSIENRSLESTPAEK
jgi:hypothetical protein